MTNNIKPLANRMSGASRLCTLLFFLVLGLAMNAQPQKFSYQAVVRDAQGQLIVNSTARVRATILQNSTEVYQETHIAQTSVYGLLSLEIGGGSVAFGNFATLDWSGEKHFVKIEIDPQNQGNYSLSSITELLSVPYALHAQTAQRVLQETAETDPLFAASVAKNITETHLEYWNKKLDSIDLNVLKTEIENLKKEVEELQIANGIANGTLIQDIDGNIYKTVQIGTQTWMAENLRVTRFNNGDTLMYIGEDSVWKNYQWYAPPAYCYYDNDPELGKIYGPLYNWFCIGNTSENKQNAGRNICPKGWHIPSESECTKMRDYLIANGYNYNGLAQTFPHINGLGKALAAPGLWNTSTSFPVGSVGHPDYAEKMNVTGFSALPGGFRQYNGIFARLNNKAFFQTSTSTNYYTMRYAFIDAESPALGFCDQTTYSATTARCVKD